MVRRIDPAELQFGLKHKEVQFVIEYCKDFNARRAAEASGYCPDSGHSIKNKPHIEAAVEHILIQRLEASHIDAEWLLLELADNHMLARQAGNIGASNTALNIIGKHVSVDAFAADKVEVSTDREIMERLLRGRKRAAGVDTHGESHESLQDESGGVVSFM